jgi:CheY-like chemotaxis protein
MPEPLSGIRIVIAEDHDDTRDILEQVLRHLGATVTAVALAREVLGIAAAADIIVTDLAMPGEDGVWLLESKSTSIRDTSPSSLSAGSLRAKCPAWRRQPSRKSC